MHEVQGCSSGWSLCLPQDSSHINILPRDFAVDGRASEPTAKACDLKKRSRDAKSIPLFCKSACVGVVNLCELMHRLDLLLVPGRGPLSAHIDSDLRGFVRGFKNSFPVPDGNGATSRSVAHIVHTHKDPNTFRTCGADWEESPLNVDVPQMRHTWPSDFACSIFAPPLLQLREERFGDTQPFFTLGGFPNAGVVGAASGTMPVPPSFWGNIWGNI